MKTIKKLGLIGILTAGALAGFGTKDVEASDKVTPRYTISDVPSTPIPAVPAKQSSVAEYKPGLEIAAWEDAKGGPSRNGIVDDGDHFYKQGSKVFDKDDKIVILLRPGNFKKGSTSGVQVDRTVQYLVHNEDTDEGRKPPYELKTVYHPEFHKEETLEKDRGVILTEPTVLQPGMYSTYGYGLDNKTKERTGCTIGTHKKFEVK